MIHSELGASSSERWLNCPGSVRMSRDLPNRSTSYSREGTVAHHVASLALETGKSALAFVGLKVLVDGIEVEATEEMCDAVQEYVDHITSKVESASPRAQRFIEVQFTLDKLNPPASMFGTSDHVLWDPDEKVLDIDDYKHGIGVAVDAYENDQLTYYALGAVLALRVKPDLIRITIVQPRAFHRDGEIRTFEFDWAHLVEFKKHLFAGAARTIDPDAPLIPGEWCRFCPAHAICPAQRALAVEVAQTEFEAADPKLPVPEALTDAQLNRALEIAPAIESWFGAIRAYLQARLEAGEDVPGWKLVAKRATRKWTDEPAAMAWATAAGVTDPYVRKPMSPAQVEAQLKQLFAKKVRPDLPETLVSKQSSGYHLAPATDPRPAANVITAQEEFTALPPADE